MDALNDGEVSKAVDKAWDEMTDEISAALGDEFRLTIDGTEVEVGDYMKEMKKGIVNAMEGVEDALVDAIDNPGKGAEMSIDILEDAMGENLKFLGDADENLVIRAAKSSWTDVPSGSKKIFNPNDPNFKTIEEDIKFFDDPAGWTKEQWNKWGGVIGSMKATAAFIKRLFARITKFFSDSLWLSLETFSRKRKAHLQLLEQEYLNKIWAEHKVLKVVDGKEVKVWPDLDTPSGKRFKKLHEDKALEKAYWASLMGPYGVRGALKEAWRQIHAFATMYVDKIVFNPWFKKIKNPKYATWLDHTGVRNVNKLLSKGTVEVIQFITQGVMMYISNWIVVGWQVGNALLSGTANTAWIFDALTWYADIFNYCDIFNGYSTPQQHAIYKKELEEWQALKDKGEKVDNIIYSSKPTDPTTKCDKIKKQKEDIQKLVDNMSAQWRKIKSDLALMKEVVKCLEELGEKRISLAKTPESKDEIKNEGVKLLNLLKNISKEDIESKEGIEQAAVIMNSITSLTKAIPLTSDELKDFDAVSGDMTKTLKLCEELKKTKAEIESKFKNYSEEKY